MRPLRVAATARIASGRTTPSTSRPSVVCCMRAVRLGSAEEAAELQATTSSFARRPAAPRRSPPRSARFPRASVRRRESARCPRGRRSPRAAARTSSSCRTVSPPTPESNTPIGRSRGSDAAGCAVHARHHSRALRSGPWCAPWWSPTCFPTPPTRSAGASSATRSPRCAACRVWTSSCRVRTGRQRRWRAPAFDLRRRVSDAARRRGPLRRRPRALRTHRLARARGSRPRARADGARDRCAPPPHAPGDARRAAADRSSRRRLRPARSRTARPRPRGAERRCCPAAWISSASTRSPAPRRARRAGPRPGRALPPVRGRPVAHRKRYDLALALAARWGSSC